MSTLEPVHGDREWRLGEREVLREVEQYIAGTYDEYYSQATGLQSIEGTIAAGHGEGFCLGCVRKYIDRYGKKGGRQRKDILKAIHYLVILLGSEERG